MKIYKNITELVGNTPLLELQNYSRELGLKATILAKLEYLNPAGSAKDRIAKKMIEAAELDGSLLPGATIIEPTSGNTGIALCAIAAAKGYKAVIVMPDSMSAERQKLMAAFGAELVLTPGALGMTGAIEKAEQIHAERPGSIIAGQFSNNNNPLAHYETTGPELWRDTEGKLDIFVATVGTGGTLSGTSRYLKEQNGKIITIAVEPADSPLLSKGYAAPHKLQGIGANFIPQTLDHSMYDEVLTATTETSYSATRLLAKKEGILAGISSGAALAAATEIARRQENFGKTIAVLLPDTGARYLSTDLF